MPLLSLVTIKAFDWLHWLYLRSILEAICFGTTFFGRLWPSIPTTYQMYYLVDLFTNPNESYLFIFIINNTNLYADDVLVFLQNSFHSVPRHSSICEEFRSMSGFQINLSKSAILHLNHCDKTLVLPVTIPVA